MNFAISYTRFSTPEQSKGNSYTRQTEKSESYCARNGLTLLPKDHYFDKGVSAFRGQNKSTGQLAKLLEDAKAGTIPPGTFLIVDNFDRLGRDNLMSQIQFFFDLLNAGLVVVTLGDREQEYRAGANFNDLLFAFISMSRANEESATKSERSKSVWKSKRKNMLEKPLTSNVPGWLEKKGDKIVTIPARVALIKEIFEMSKNGHGRRAIAKELNDQKTPTFGGADFWHDTFIRTILKNRSVLGEFAPHSREGAQKKVPEGEPVAGYYPAIIDEETFLIVQHRLTSRIQRGGRKPIYKAGNLFSSRLRCFCCGYPVHFADKGRNYTYLNCSNRLMTKSCASLAAPYKLIEKTILEEMTQIDWQALMSPETSKSTSDQVAALSAKVAEYDQKINNLLDVLEDDTLSGPAILARIAKLQNGKEETAAALEELVGTSEAQNKARHMADQAAKEKAQFLHLAEHEETRQTLKKHIDDLLTRVYVEFDGEHVQAFMIFAGGGVGYISKGLSKDESEEDFKSITYKFETGGGEGNEASLGDSLALLLPAKDFANLQKWEPQLFNLGHA